MTDKKTSIKKPELNELKEANDSQIKSYFASYDRFWRLHKLLLLKRLLRERESIRGDFSEYYGPHWVPDYDQIIYRNITDGILADALSETTMLCEDYFCLLRYIRETRYFVKKAIYYSAGEVTKLPNQVEKPTIEMLRKMFFIPGEKFIESSFARANLATANSELNEVDRLLKEMEANHRSTVLFHRNHSYIQGQYKHGLKLVLHEQSGSMKKEELARRKTEFKGPLWYFENKDQERMLDYGATMIPDFSSQGFRKNFAHLAATRNMLRIGLLRNIDIDYLIAVARNTIGLVSALINNRLSLIDNARGNLLIFELPLPSAALESKRYTILLHTGQTKPRIDDYQF